MIKAGESKFSPITLQAESMYERSGLRFESRGVGTAITTISEPLISAGLVVALYLPLAISFAIEILSTPSMWELPALRHSTISGFKSKPTTSWCAPAKAEIVRPTYPWPIIETLNLLPLWVAWV